MAKNKWVSGVIILLVRVINLFLTGGGPPCTFSVPAFPKISGNMPSQKVMSKVMQSFQSEDTTNSEATADTFCPTCPHDIIHLHIDLES